MDSKFFCTSFIILFYSICSVTNGYFQVGKPPEAENHAAINAQQAPTLRLMTFNLWNSGEHVENGMGKIAKHILNVNPDIIALEEINTPDTLTDLLGMLGTGWTGKVVNESFPDTAIATRHIILPTNESMETLWDHGGTRARIRLVGKGLNNQVVSFYAVHLNAATYGPYVACSTLANDSMYVTAAEAGAGTGYEGRIGNAYGISSMACFQEDLASTDYDMPMFLLGDMNTPSHLDWPDDANSKVTHCGWTYQWPVTKIWQLNGLTDAFRQVHPDNVAVPGVTWSTVTPWMDGWPGMIPEPQDRIDMVFYKTKQWIPVDAQTYAGTEPITPKPNYYCNDWPSDHYSVYVDFQYVG